MAKDLADAGRKSLIHGRFFTKSPAQHLMRTKLVLLIVALLFRTAAVAQLDPSYNLWSITNGVVVTTNSHFALWNSQPNAFDSRDVFGGEFTTFPYEKGDVVFDDSAPDGFVHFIQWRTRTPVTVESFKLFAKNDYPTPRAREFAQFTLKAKSLGSTNFDLVLFQFQPGNPYRYIDSKSYLLLAAQIPPTTAQEFRAEFVGLPRQSFGGPRITELQAFGATNSSYVSIAPATVDICWNTASNQLYQIQYSSVASTNLWNNLGTPVTGDGTVQCVTDTVRGLPTRYYRVVTLP